MAKIKTGLGNSFVLSLPVVVYGIATTAAEGAVYVPLQADQHHDMDGNIVFVVFIYSLHYLSMDFTFGFTSSSKTGTGHSQRDSDVRTRRYDVTEGRSFSGDGQKKSAELLTRRSLRGNSAVLTNKYAYRPILDLYTHWYIGQGTYYGSEGEGTCQISRSNLPPAALNSRYLAALNIEQFMGSATCGMCFRVQGSGRGRGSDPVTGDFIVYVKDLCPGCKTGDVDIAVAGDGRWDIRIQAIQCPVGNTAIQYWFRGSNPFFVRLQVRNARVPVQRVKMRTVWGRWVELRLSRDGHWQYSARFNDVGSIPVRLMSVSGAIVNDVIPRLINGVVMEGQRSVQFPPEASLPDV